MTARTIQIHYRARTNKNSEQNIAKTTTSVLQINTAQNVTHITHSHNTTEMQMCVEGVLQHTDMRRRLRPPHEIKIVLNTM